MSIRVYVRTETLEGVDEDWYTYRSCGNCGGNFPKDKQKQIELEEGNKQWNYENRPLCDKCLKDRKIELILDRFRGLKREIEIISEELENLKTSEKPLPSQFCRICKIWSCGEHDL